MLEAQVFLVAMVRLAGLQIDMHHCESPCCESGFEVALGLAAIFPLKVSRGQCGSDSAVVTGFPADFTRALCSKLRGAESFGMMDRATAPCTCTVKTMVVPAAGMAR